jgi:hypothetical protein
VRSPTNIPQAKPEVSTPLIPQPTIGHDSEPVHPLPFLTNLPKIIGTSKLMFTKMFPHQNCVCIPLLLNPSYLPIISRFHRFRTPNNAWKMSTAKIFVQHVTSLQSAALCMLRKPSEKTKCLLVTVNVRMTVLFKKEFLKGKIHSECWGAFCSNRN